MDSKTCKAVENITDLTEQHALLNGAHASLANAQTWIKRALEIETSRGWKEGARYLKHLDCLDSLLYEMQDWLNQIDDDIADFEEKL